MERPRLAWLAMNEPSDQDHRSDVLVAVIMTLCTAFWGDLFGSGAQRPDYTASVITSIGLVMPLAIRRRHPLLMVGIMGVAGMAQAILVSSPTWSLWAVPFASYSVARQVPGITSRSVILVGSIGAVAGPLHWVVADPRVRTAEEMWANLIPLTLLCWAWVVIPYLIGRRDRDNAAADEERTLSAIRRYEAEIEAREQQARSAEVTARNEIARELHDVVAHSLSVIIVQADGGKALARKKPEAAGEVLETISTIGRDALSEMRRIVGVLRADPDEAEYRPSPGLTDIPTLVETSGETVKLIERGARPDVSDVLGLTVYRVIQEALTNVVKHAGEEAHAVVIVDYSLTEIDIEVVDDGSGRQHKAAIPDGGYGLQGMRERVTSLGGKLTAGPSRQGGWIVHVVLPLHQNGAS